MKTSRLALSLALCALVAVSAAFYSVRQENERLRKLVRTAEAQPNPYSCMMTPIIPAEKIAAWRHQAEVTPENGVKVQTGDSWLSRPGVVTNAGTPSGPFGDVPSETWDDRHPAK